MLHSYRSPTEMPFTSLPISLTTPANSWPKVTHFAEGNSPAKIWRSVPHIPEKATLTRTSFGAETWGIGVVMTDSWPSQSCTAVFMASFDCKGSIRQRIRREGWKLTIHGWLAWMRECLVTRVTHSLIPPSSGPLPRHCHEVFVNH